MLKLVQIEKNREFFRLAATAEFNRVIKDVQQCHQIGDRVLFLDVSQESLCRIVLRTRPIVLTNSHQYSEHLDERIPSNYRIFDV